MNEAALPRMVGKKRKPPGKVFTLQQLCSPSGDRPATSPELRALLSGSRPQSREGDLEGWLKNAFAAQHVAVKEALSKHQLLIMQELLGPMDVSPSSVAPNFPNEKPVPLPGGSPQHMISEKAQGRMLHPVEPEAPPLPPMPPLPNQLLDDGAASPFSKDTLDTASDDPPKASALEVKPKEGDEGDTGEGSRPLATLERHVTEGSRLFDQNRRASTGAGAGAASKLAFRRADEILDQLKMPFWHPGRIVRTTQFDAFICAVIMLNTLMMAFESQYLGLQRGYDLGFPRFTLPASEEWPYADLGFYMADYVFGVIYLVEICIKIAGLRCEFFKDGWNYFDSSLVLFWIIEKSLSAYAVLDQGMLRVLRMGRVLRLLRLVKTIQGFDALYIMTTAMQGSVTVLFWSFVLLMVVQTLIAFTLNQALDSYFRDQSKPVHQQHQVFLYFGTTGRAMFTMFELTLANWPTAARVLQENVTEYYAIFSVAYKLVIGFAAVGIINAVFMQETFKVAASDDKLMMRQKERDRMLHTKKMRTLFAAADESGDGVLDQDEFREIMTSPDIRTWLAAQELPIRDPDILWQLLDDGDAELTADELVTGVERLKGTAKGIDLAAFILEHRKFQNRVCEKLGLEIEEDDD